jgi:hypothetical protein
MNQTNKIIRIGGASGFWGDSMVGAPQLVCQGDIQYLVFDYLAETTMAILTAARRKSETAGYATDFVDVAMRSVLKEVDARRIKVLANAGGINPQACAAALHRLMDELGVQLKVAVVEGDNLAARLPELTAAGTCDMFSGQPLPQSTLSANAYLGAWPVAAALADGADIVITGRCVDSALVLGPLIHEFGWQATDLNQLSGGSLAGHIIECGCQATGGLHTDWESVPGWANIGYPIIACEADGSFTVSKPEGTGGIVRAAAVAEQLLYEIGDPSAYMLPDVVCDWRHVRIQQLDADHVRVDGAKGRPPTPHYKVSATAMDGYRCAGTMVIVGIDAVKKAERTAQAILQRTRAMFQQLGWADYTATHVEVIGAESLYGPHSQARHAREVMMRLVVNHPKKEALELFAREIAPSGTSWSPGTTSPGGGRPGVSPLIRPLSFLIPKDQLTVTVSTDGHGRQIAIPVGMPLEGGSLATPGHTDFDPLQQPNKVGRLIDLAWARSGDKGNISNIGVIARSPELLPWILSQLTPDSVKTYMAHLVHGRVERFLVPGISAVNLMLHDALDGGGPASMRMDPLGKGMGQILLDMPLRIPAALSTAHPEV